MPPPGFCGPCYVWLGNGRWWVLLGEPVMVRLSTSDLYGWKPSVLDELDLSEWNREYAEAILEANADDLDAAEVRFTPAHEDPWQTTMGRIIEVASELLDRENRPPRN